jgi:hypothetical protein
MPGCRDFLVNMGAYRALRPIAAIAILFNFILFEIENFQELPEMFTGKLCFGLGASHTSFASNGLVV